MMWMYDQIEVLLQRRSKDLQSTAEHLLEASVVHHSDLSFWIDLLLFVQIGEFYLCLKPLDCLAEFDRRFRHEV